MLKKLSISKSRYLSGLQCPKLLWHYYNAKHLIPPPDPTTQALFDHGHRVGDMAKKLYPEGIEVEWNISFVEIIARSKLLLKKRQPLFEAGFLARGAYARVDILDPVGEDEWDIVEVKSGAAVQEINLHDLAFQRYCYEGAGIKIHRCYLMHTNPEHSGEPDSDPESLFTKEDVTDLLVNYSDGIEGRLREMFKVIRGRECPRIELGGRCSDPYRCPLTDVCRNCDVVTDCALPLLKKHSG